MQNCCDDDIKRSDIFIFPARVIFLLMPLSCCSFISAGQICPPNIDFESGTFANWTCYTGSVATVSGQNVISLNPVSGPIPNRHTMYDASQYNGFDYFGGFPISCPNGSGYSVKLGNTLGGAEAEGLSYEFTIPANQNIYSLIYHYAVVFQDPNHQQHQQPRLELEITNLTDNEIIYCSSFTFFPTGSILPGFFISPMQQDTVNVWCKDWTAVSINLNGKAGKTIRLFFKTADCTFVRHFGYAYIDVNTECSSEFVGATYCPDDTAVVVTAPYGYQDYTWYNSNFTQALGNQQTIEISPPPPSGATIAVEVVPYNGYGCIDTFYALLIDTLTVIANAGRDTISCNRNSVPIGVNPVPGYVYSWSPAAGLSNAYIANPRAGPALTTSYILTVRSRGGGCATTDTVVVTASVVDSSLTLLGKDMYCITSGDSSVLTVPPTFTIQWFKENTAISGANQPRYKVTQSGSYHALLINDKGCRANTPDKTILIEQPRPGVTYPVQYAVINYPQQLQARSFGISAEWSPGTYLSDPASFTPVFKGSSEIQYTVGIRTAAGCITVDTQLVKTFKEVKIYVPTAFTPNNDGLNDYLKPIPVGIKQLRYFRVYNRWGQLLYDLNSNAKGWDGAIGGKPQPTQMVVWITEGIGLDDRVYKLKGTALLIR